ncbi:hypothetical protein [Streptosporangium jomthongense]|uniref:Uncharacterized protein n=1 Tax=Streptosporangium jomthongense TaxID=1193683 RepID=A0ABV8F5S6_9ACTN
MTFLIQRLNATPPPSISEESDTPPFTSPALGEAFDFTVKVHLSWLRNNRRSQWTPDSEEANHVNGLIRQTIRATTRRHSIFEPDAAETAVNIALDRCLSGVSRTDAKIISRWSARAELELPEEVKEVRRTHLFDMHAIEARAEAAKLRVEKLRETGAVWEDLLSEATGSAFARYAVRLTENPENVADIFEQMLDARREEAEKLFKLVAEIVAAQRTAGIYDLVLATDSALRQAFERLGVPIPLADPDSMFAPLDEIS